MTHPSPFLPNTAIQYAWDSTSLNYLKTCPRLYYYIIIAGWASKGESVHLRFGLEYHQALQEYDVSRANGVSHEDAIHDVVAALMERTWDWNPDRDTKAGRYKNRETLVSLVVDYLDHFGGNDPAETYIKADGRPAVELSFQFALDWGPKVGAAVSYDNIDGITSQPYLLCGHLDRVVSFNDQLLVMDRKTTTRTLGSFYFNQWEPHNQMTLYTLAGRIVLGAPIKGVCIDAAQVKLEEPNSFARGFTYRTQDQLDEWLNDLAILLRQAEIYAEQNYWPMNDTSCTHYRSEDSGQAGCPFMDICSKSPAVRDRFLAADFIQQPEEERWNPLKPR